MYYSIWSANFREEFVFTFFVSKEPFTKIKTAKLLSTWKVNEPRFNVSTDTRIRHQNKDKSGSSHCYKHLGYEATFLTTQEQRAGIAISISKQFRYTFSS